MDVMPRASSVGHRGRHHPTVSLASPAIGGEHRETLPDGQERSGFAQPGRPGVSRTDHRPAHTQGTANSTDLRRTTNAGGPRRPASHVSANRATRSGFLGLVLIAGGVALALGEREAERPGLRASVRINDSLFRVTRAVSEVTAVGTVGLLLVLAGFVPAGLLAAHPVARLAWPGWRAAGPRPGQPPRPCEWFSPQPTSPGSGSVSWSAPASCR